MGTPSGMAAMGMGGKTMPTPSKSMSGSWGSSSATASASASASPIFTGAAQKMSGSIAGVVVGIFAVVGLI